MNKQYFAYVRVSTVRQGEGASLDAQRDAINAYATRHDLNITQWFEEKETAAKQGRPIFTDAVKALQRGRANGIVMHKIDRSARNLRDWATVSELQDAGIDVHFAAESVDFASRGGRLTADIQAVIAADYIRNLREETLKGINGRLKQGLYPFKAPIGYLDHGSGKLKSICATKGPMVRQLFESYATGSFTLMMLVAEAKRLGLRNARGGPISKTCVEKMLSNPFYIGLIRMRRADETYQGKHQPLISTRLFKAVQNIRAGKATQKKTKHQLTYRRIFDCGKCGRTYRAERQKGHVYYRCHTKGCTKGTLREEFITGRVQSEIGRIELTHTQRRHLEAVVQGIGSSILTSTSRPSVQLELGKVKQRRAQLLDALLEQLIDKQTFEHRNAELLLLETDLCEQVQETIKPRDLERAVKDLVELLQSLCHTYFMANIEEKRQLLEILFANRVITDKNVELSTNIWTKRALETVSVLSSAHLRALCRRNLPLPSSVIEQLEALFTCQEWKALQELYHTIQKRQTQVQLPETTSATNYLNAA